MLYDDRGVAAVSIRCLAIAAECLVTRQSQEEVLQIFDKIIKETGFQIGFLRGELVEKWGWNTAQSQQQQQQQHQQHQHSATANTGSLLGSSLLNSAMHAGPSPPHMPKVIVN